MSELDPLTQPEPSTNCDSSFSSGSVMAKLGSLGRVMQFEPGTAGVSPACSVSSVLRCRAGKTPAVPAKEILKLHHYW
jgi:hypothetical protein